MNKAIIITIISAIMLSGCSLFKEKPRDVVIIASKIDVCATPPKADKIIMRTVNFKIVKDEFGIYWIGVTPKYYENLSINMKEIIQHIKQKNAIVKYYKSCHADRAKKDAEEKPSDTTPKQ